MKQVSAMVKLEDIPANDIVILMMKIRKTETVIFILMIVPTKQSSPDTMEAALSSC